MSLFNSIHRIKKNKYIISKEIDEYLISLEYKIGDPVFCDHPNDDGLCMWACGELYDTHICIYSDKIYFYKEYNCGGHINDGIVDIPDSAKENKESFKTFLEKVFEDNSYLFDSSLQS